MSDETKTVVLPVTGMTCASCATAIERGLSKLPGVSLVNVNVATENVSIHYDPSQVDISGLVGAISQAGYGVGLERATRGRPG
jgi:Cu+-exporting ATPase